MNVAKYVAATAVMAMLSSNIIAADAQTSAQLQGGVAKHKTGTYLQNHPKVKAATVGGAIGAGTGAVVGLVSGKGAVRGAAIGAGTGAGVGLIEKSKTLKHHTMIKDTAVGATAGLGLALAVSKGHGTGKKAAEAAALGGALGLGAGFLKKHF